MTANSPSMHADKGCASKGGLVIWVLRTHKEVRRRNQAETHNFSPSQGTRRLGHTPAASGSWPNPTLRVEETQSSSSPACAQPCSPPLAAARRPAPGGKRLGNLRASRADTAAALFVPQPRDSPPPPAAQDLPRTRHPRPSTPSSLRRRNLSTLVGKALKRA